MSKKLFTMPTVLTALKKVDQQIDRNTLEQWIDIGWIEVEQNKYRKQGWRKTDWASVDGLLRNKLKWQDAQIAKVYKSLFPNV